MKLSKKLIGLSVIMLGSAALVGCASGSSSSSSSSSKADSSKTSSSASSKKVAKKVTAGAPIKDGTYNLEEKNYENNYRAKLSMTVKDGKISDTSFDYVNKDGKSKKDDANYNKQMKAKSGTDATTYIPKLTKEFKDSNADVGNIAVVSGATHTSRAFLNYAQQLIQAAQAGNTQMIEIDNGAKMKDGTYELAEKNDSHDYHVVFSMTVKDGKITDSKYDYVNKDGKSKKDDADYNKQMQDKSGTSPKKYIEALNKDLVKKQKPAEVDVVSGATESSNTFVIYAEQLINAAQKGDTNKIEVDNYVFGN